MRWQDVAKYLGLGTGGILFVLAGILNLSGMEYSVPPDLVCEDCYSRLDINSTYWEVNVEHSGPDKDILYKKRTRSRTLWINLDKVDSFVLTEPKVPVEILVPTVKRYATMNHEEFGYLRPLKDGDTLIARKNKYNPNGDWFIIHGTTDGKRVKWGLDLDDWLSEGIEFDPIWDAQEFSFDLVMDCWNETKERYVENVKEVLVKCDVSNKSCSPHYVNKTTYVKELYKVEHCKEIGVNLEGKEIMYKQKEMNCLRTGNTLCCWDYRDGGSNLGNRAEEFRTQIRSGESGFCRDLTDNLKQLSYRSDWGDLKLAKEIK